MSRIESRSARLQVIADSKVQIPQIAVFDAFRNLHEALRSIDGPAELRLHWCTDCRRRMSWQTKAKPPSVRDEGSGENSFTR